MATEPKRSAKTDILSMRIDPKTRFAIEVVARYRGQSISTVVERAIMEAADHASIGSGDQPNTWRDYWDVSEGVRALKIASDQSLYPTYEDERKVDLAKRHWQFFYSSDNARFPRVAFIDILWPRIDEFLEMWEKTRSTDRFAVGKAMHKAIHDAGVQPPDWPPKPAAKAPPAPATVASGTPSWDAPKGGDLDDEIPF